MLPKCTEKKLHKNATSNTEQILEATLHKTAAIRPPATHHEKLSKLDEPDIRDTAEEVRTNSKATYSCRPLHMDEQRQGDQLVPILNNSVPIQYIALKTNREQWTIKDGIERMSGKSVLSAGHDDDDDDVLIKICM